MDRTAAHAGLEGALRVLFPAAALLPSPSGLKAGGSEEPRGVGQAATPSLSGTILVVDDQDAVREVCQKILEYFGLTVLTAVDGLDAVEVFRQRSAEIDGIVLDLMMPRMDGLAAFQELRRIKPGVRVILSSGYEEQEATARFTGAGLAGFVHKPYTLQTLRAAVEHMLASE